MVNRGGSAPIIRAGTFYQESSTNYTTRRALRIDLDNNVRWDTGVAITAAQYEIGRDADATNQMHLNVPTGATFEFSINDVAHLIVRLGGLQFPTGEAISATLYQIKRDADATNKLHLNVPTGATLEFSVNDVSSVVLGALGLAFLNDIANANMTTGLTINQAGADNEILALKSSDVAHGSIVTETDTYGLFVKRNATAGGLLIRGLQATGFNGEALILQGFNKDAADTTDTSSSRGVMQLGGIVNDGAVGAGGNILAVDTNGTTRFLIKTNGDIHATNTTITALDDLPDALAGRAARTYLAEPLGGLEGVRYFNRELADALERRHIIHFNRHVDGVAFMNLQNSIMFSWDMAFQGFVWLAEIAGVLTDEQRGHLSPQFRAALKALPSLS